MKRIPTTIDVVSEMLLACNQDSIRDLSVDSPLTGEAIYRLPKLLELRVVIEGHTPLPPFALPSLTRFETEFDDHLDWLEGFRGATLDKLESVIFLSKSTQIGHFFEAFERVALTTSIQNTLSWLRFYASSPRNADYYHLLSFKQLKKLEIISTWSSSRLLLSRGRHKGSSIHHGPKPQLNTTGVRGCSRVQYREGYFRFIPCSLWQRTTLRVCDDEWCTRQGSTVCYHPLPFFGEPVHTVERAARLNMDMKPGEVTPVTDKPKNVMPTGV